uniref:RCC1-like domain-containing protein n=1 Tax=Kalanchoe fedtschenkoi TaxID=63787 RepID=A0A7N0VMZ6_KALFE
MEQITSSEVVEVENHGNSCPEEEVWSWGAGTEGQLGTGKLEDELFPQQIHFPSGDSIAQLACGGAHTIALTSRGKVLTWGRGTSGQLGHGEMVNSLKPKLLEALTGYVVVHVAAGWSHSGFVTDTGILYTCGDGSFGQLGHGDYQSHCVPKAVSLYSFKHVVQVACGMRHSIVLVKGDSEGDKVYGFGSGRRGQLGVSNDKVKSVNEPVSTLGLEDVQIGSLCASGDHSAALSIEGEIYTWGRGFNGSPDLYSPQRVDSHLCFTQVCLGWNHALLLTGNGEVFMLGRHRHENSEKHCSGNAIYGEVALYRVQVGSRRVVQIASGAEHSAVVTEGGDILTWGWGEHGQLGLGNTSDESSPRAVKLGSRLGNGDTVGRVYCGSGFTFGVKSSSARP